MATAINLLRFTTRRCSARIPALVCRPFGSSSTVRNEAPLSSQTSDANSAFKLKLPERTLAVYESLSDDEKQQFEKAFYEVETHMNKPSVDARFTNLVAQSAHMVNQLRD